MPDEARAVDDTNAAVDRLDAQALRPALATALADLEQRDREALLLVAWADLSYAAATPVAADTLQRARSAPMDEIAAETAGSLDGTPARLRPVRQGGRAGWLRGGAAAAAAAAALAVLLPSLLGTGATAAIALAPADPLTFPLTPASLPADLGQPVFDKEPGLALAVYPGQGSDRIMVSVREGEAQGRVPADARNVEIAGHDAVLFGGNGLGEPTTSLVWQDRRGRPGRGHGTR